MPPSYTRLLEYYAPTNSVLEIIAESEAPPLASFEGLHIGSITCLAAPTPRLLVSGGTDNLVRIWTLGQSTTKQQAHECNLKKTLYGHAAPVRNLAVCVSYNILVSGSDDHTCIVWDLTRCKVRL